MLRAFEDEPRPKESQALDTTRTAITLQRGTELRRLRLAAWRLVYLVEDEATLVTELAIRKRPPYQCDDLDELLKHT